MIKNDSLSPSTQEPRQTSASFGGASTRLGFQVVDEEDVEMLRRVDQTENRPMLIDPRVRP